MQIKKIKRRFMMRNLKLDEFISEFAIFIFLLITGNADLSMQSLIFWPNLIIQLAAIMILMSKHKCVIRYFMYFYLAFLAYVGLSMFWALNVDYTRVKFILLLEYALPLTVVSSYVSDKDRLIRILRLFISAALINGLYVVIFVGLNNLRATSVDFVETAWNANSIGLMMAYSSFALFYLQYNRKSFVPGKMWLNYPIGLFCVLILAISASRKALAVLMGFIAISYLITNRNRLIKFCEVLIAAVIAFFLIIKIPILYNSIGIRMEGLLGLTGTIDASTSIRLEMIELGCKWIKEKSLIGYGFDNFRTLYYAHLPRPWNDTYSHNNYIELLVGGGIIGLVLYYQRYFYLLAAALKCKNLIRQKFIIPIVLIFMVIEVGLVDYFDYFVQFFVCLCFAPFYSCNMRREKDDIR